MGTQQTTLDLDAMMQANAPVVGEELEEEVLSGHPAAAAAQPGPAPKDDNPTPPTNPSISPDANDSAGQPAAAGASDGASGPDAGTDAGAAPAEDAAARARRLRFKSHEDAERGYADLFSLHQTTSQRLKKLEAEAQSTAAIKAQADADAEFEQKLAVYSRQRNAEALKAINALDPELPDYDDRVADAWAAKDVDVARFMRGHLSAAPAPTAASASAPAAADAAVDAGGADESAAWNYAFGEAQKAGIDKSDPVFLHWCHEVPGVDDKGQILSLEDRVRQVIDETKAHYTRVRERFIAEQAEKARTAAEAHQRSSQPLGSSAARPRSGGAAAPSRIGINDALAAVADERRI